METVAETVRLVHGEEEGTSRKTQKKNDSRQRRLEWTELDQLNNSNSKRDRYISAEK